VHLSRRQFVAATSGATAAAALLGNAVPAIGTEDDPLGVRRDFPAAASGLYLNSAYIAPVPLPVAAAAHAFVESKAHAPIPLGDMLKKTDEVRGQFARLVGATQDEIGFLFATSEGENIVAASLDLKVGDNVVVDELHYTTTFVLYRHLQQTRGIDLRIVRHRNGAVTRQDFERAVDDRTRLLSVAWVSHQNGFRHEMRPLADLAHAHGALFYTDAIQAVGMFPVDVVEAGVDVMTSGTYKWLLGGFGVAPFYVKRELLDRIRVDRLGALHVERELDDHQFTIYSTAKKFDYATLPFAEVYQLGAALSYLDRVGVDRIGHHTIALAGELRHGLAAAGFRVLTPPDNGSSIVSLAIRNAARAHEVLDKAGVQVSFRENGTQIRVSPALFTTRAEIQRFLELASSFV